MTRILSVDDHEAVRHGLRHILEEEFSDMLFGEARDGGEAIEALCGGDWDVVLLDLSMPDSNGLDVLKDLKKMRPSVPILILSVHREDLYAVQALKAGASGYVMKNADPAEINAAVHAVLAGKSYISPSLTRKFMSSL